MKGLLFLSIIIFPTLLFGQLITKTQLTYLENYSQIIDFNDEFSDSNWDSISEEFKDKEVILLGEFNHGSKEVFEIRNSLIKYLHEKLNFDVILFESGIGELITPNHEMELQNPEQMTNGFFGGWRTKEFVDLMEYVRDNNMKIAGFDVQRTGNSFNKVLNNIASPIISDSTLYFDLEDRYTVISKELRQGKPYNSLKIKTKNLIDDYRRIYNLLSADTESKKSPSQLLVQKTILNRIAYLDYFLEFNNDKDWSKRWAARDSVMADNVLWLAENIYQDKKLIVVGHNFHISKFNEKETVMGEILLETYTQKMYSIGTFARAGSYANNSGNEEFMSAPDSTQLDIKHIISSLNGYANYIPIPKYPKPGSQWLNEKLVVNDTFIDLYGTNSMTLSKHFDGLLLLDHVSPPKK